MKETHRLKILKHIQSLYVSAVDKENPGEGETNYGVHFSIVGIGPLGDTESRKRFSVGIVPGREYKSDIYPAKSSMFDVTMEYRAAKTTEDISPLLLAEKLLGVVQQIMYDDPTLGGLCIKHDEIGNEQDVYNYSGRTVMGAVQFRIHYRHDFNSVYTYF